MNAEKKFRTIRVRSTLRPTESLADKSQKRIIKVSKKINRTISLDESIEKDFILESGDPTEFLKPAKDNLESQGYTKFEGIIRKSCSSAAKFNQNSSKDISTEHRPDARNRRLTIRYAFAQQFMNRGLNFLDYEKHINKHIEEINKRIDVTKAKEGEMVKKLSPNQRTEFLRQDRSLKCFDTAEKAWKKIDLGLVKKASRSIKELLSHKIIRTQRTENNKKPTWSNTLRIESKSDKVEMLIPVGNKLSGIFIRDIVRLKRKKEMPSQNTEDLKVLGASKLPLEIEAVKKVGTYLGKKQDPDDKAGDEMIAEHYDFIHNFFRKF